MQLGRNKRFFKSRRGLPGGGLRITYPALAPYCMYSVRMARTVGDLAILDRCARDLLLPCMYMRYMQDVDRCKQPGLW